MLKAIWGELVLIGGGWWDALTGGPRTPSPSYTHLANRPRAGR